MQKIKQIIAKIQRYSYSLIISPFTKYVSKKDFAIAYIDMKKLYLENKNKYDFLEFIEPQWHKNMLEIEQYFLNDFSFSFLNYPVIKRTMFMYTFKNWKDIQKKLISEYFTKDQVKKILREYSLGRPLLNDAEYVTSGNNIHHLYHLVKFFKETNTSVENFNTIVEVGGGYGNLAKICKNLNKEVTYIIIDIPIFSYIQAVYLKTILGKDSVHIVHNNEVIIKKGLINIIPLDKNILGKLNELIVSVDLFVSTWALSESNEVMQNYIRSVDYFKAKYILLAYQKSDSSFHFAEDVKNITENYNKVFNEETEYVSDSYYLFCKNKSIN